jgi:hypothetical protein
MAIVARLLRGEPLDLVARQINVSVARLTEWRDRALAGAATALKERERDDRDDEIARLKSKVGEITMDNELLYARYAAGVYRCPQFGSSLVIAGSLRLVKFNAVPPITALGKKFSMISVTQFGSQVGLSFFCPPATRIGIAIVKTIGLQPRHCVGLQVARIEEHQLTAERLARAIIQTGKLLRGTHYGDTVLLFDLDLFDTIGIRSFRPVDKGLGIFSPVLPQRL